MRVLNDQILNTEAGSTFTSEVQQLEHMWGYSVYHSITDTTPGAGVDFATTDVDTTENTITETAHGFLTGLKGQFTTTDTLPAGLSTSTDYWVIKVDADTYQVAASLENALAGTAVDITDQGTGTHTFTATALAGTVNYQASLDNETWVTLSSPATNAFVGDESVFVNVADVYYNYFRLQVVLTAGQCSATARINAKGI